MGSTDSQRATGAPTETGPGHSGTDLAVKFDAVSKRFGTVLANDRITFDVRPGEIHAVVGENGAGKSTLMGMLSGFVRPDSGEIRIHGASLPPGGPRHALAMGVGLCAQHFHQVPTLNGLENILLGGRGHGGEPRVRQLMERYGLQTELHRPVEDLSVGEQERIEILKLLYRDAKILVLDEPTAVLAPSEVEQLFVVLRELASEGRAVLFVSHKLPEVVELADRVSVLRGGRWVGTLERGDFEMDRLVSLIVGGDAPPEVAWTPREPGETVLRVHDLVAGDEGHQLQGLSFDVRAGEIVGVGGVEGNGQRELVHTLLGYRPAISGRVELSGRLVQPHRELGFRRDIAVIPEDRHHEGLLLSRDLVANAGLGKHEESDFSRRGGVDWSRLRAHAREIVTDYDVRPTDLSRPARQFSGGNQQRFIAGRELTRERPLLLAVHPTRGVDLMAVQFLHQRLLEERARGAAILLVTADLAELQALSDRILVLYRGGVAYDAPRERLDRAALNGALLGVIHR